MALKTIHIVAVVLVVVVVAGAAFAMANNGNDSSGDYLDIKTSLARDGGIQKVAFEANKDLFKDGVAAGDVAVYVTDLNGYVHSEWFDTNTFMSDLTATGILDEKYQIMIPADAVKLTGSDITVVQDGGKKLTVQFKASASEYCLYQVEFSQKSVGMEGVVFEEYNIPKGQMPTPALKITGTYNEYQIDPSIEVTITGGSFESGIQTDAVLLDGGFAELTVTGVSTVSDDKIVISTEGMLPMSNGIKGIVALTADAYVGPSWYTEDRLNAEVLIDYNSVIIDTLGVDFYDETNLKVPAYFSQSYYDRLTKGKLTLGAIGTSAKLEVSMKDVKEIGDETFTGYRGFLVVPADILFADDYATLILYSDGEQVTDLATYSDSVMALVYDASADGKKFKIAVVPILMELVPGVTADSFVFPDGFKVNSFKVEDGTAYFDVSVTETPSLVSCAIEAKAGTFLNITGEPSEELVMCAAFASDEPLVEGTVLYGLGGDPTTDDMIKAIYGSTRFNDIYSIVELGVGVVSTILESSGLISIPDPEEMRFQALMLQCERIQVMIADVNAKLDKVSNQIMKLDQKIDQVQMTLLRDQYSKYVMALNNLDNTSSLFSKHIKTSLYNDVITGSGPFYIYLVENNKSTHKTDMFSIKHGDYSKETTGAVIGEHKVLKTVALPVGAGTFKLASQTSKYVEGNYDKEGSTANRMIKDLTEYYTANPIDGYTAKDLAIGTYKAIIYKLVELATVKEGGDGDKLINAYKQYVSVTASLHNGVYDPNITNFYHSGIDYVEYKYNFYSETKQILQTMSYSATMNVFIYGALVNVLDQLSISSDDSLPKYMNEGIKYLKGNTGARDSDAYSYVAHGKLSLATMKIHSNAVFKSKDNFDGNVDENLHGNDHWHTLGNNRYVTTDMINKINERWNALGSPESSLANYITKHTGAKLKTYLMTKFDGEGDFSAGDCMYLQTAKRPVMSGDAEYRILPASKWLTLSSSFSAIKTYSESFDKNIKLKFTYNGEVLNLSNLSPVKVGGKWNCLYAYAAVIDHRWNFVFDEATYFTSYGYYDDDDFYWDGLGDGMRRYIHQTVLDYLLIS